MTISVFQKGFNYAQDGTGNRLVYHLQGCNLACPWCSNPEGVPFEGGTLRTVKEIVEEALRCGPMFFDGGGVTFTGGECTCQFDALKEILFQLKQVGISTAIETNGTSPRLPELFPLLDELIMDCKHPDSEQHRRFTGHGNEQIIANLQEALRLHPRLLIRMPLIGGFNATEETIRQFADLFADKDTTNTRFELLLYHEYGKDKWEKCGKLYTMKDAFVTEDERLNYESLLREYGLHVVRT